MPRRKRPVRKRTLTELFVRATRRTKSHEDPR
jgi:hypothetical protein